MFHCAVFLGLLTFLSCHMLYSTGTTNMVITCRSIPPKVGMAMGTMMSDPLPVDESTGKSASTATEAVIMAGLTRLIPACSTAFLSTCLVDVFFRPNNWDRSVPQITPQFV